MNKLKTAAYGLLCFVVACGGGGSSDAPVVIGDAPARVLFVQQGAPAVINDPGDASAFPRDVGFVVTFDLGPVGISVDERGVGMVSDAGGGNSIKTMNLSWMPSEPVKPWREHATVCTNFEATVPESVLRGAPGSYAGADLWLTDMSTGKATSGKTIIFSGFFFVDAAGDGPRADYGPADYLASLNAVQFGGPINGHWFGGSGTLREQPWSEPASFGFCLNRAQVTAMVNAASPMLGGTIDINDLALTQALLSHETAIGEGSARLATYFSGWSVTIRNP